MNETNKLLFGTIPTTTTKMWLIFEIDKGVLCRGKVSLQQQKPNRASEWVLEIFWSLVWTQTDDRTKRNEQRIDLLFYMYINSHQIIKAAFVVSFYSMACSSWLKCDEPASVLFLEAMTHFSFGNLYIMNVWDTLCMYAHTRHRCRMNIFFC